MCTTLNMGDISPSGFCSYTFFSRLTGVAKAGPGFGHVPGQSIMFVPLMSHDLLG